MKQLHVRNGSRLAGLSSMGLYGQIKVPHTLREKICDGLAIPFYDKFASDILSDVKESLKKRFKKNGGLE